MPAGITVIPPPRKSETFDLWQQLWRAQKIVVVHTDNQSLVMGCLTCFSVVLDKRNCTILNVEQANKFNAYKCFLNQYRQNHPTCNGQNTSVRLSLRVPWPGNHVPIKATKVHQGNFVQVDGDSCGYEATRQLCSGWWLYLWLRSYKATLFRLTVIPVVTKLQGNFVQVDGDSCGYEATRQLCSGWRW